MSVLLTGFEPFRQWAVNSSGEAVRTLAGQAGLATSILPVDHVTAAEALAALIAEHQPQAILATGLSPHPVPKLELHAHRPETVSDGTPLLHGVWPWAPSLGAIRGAGAPVRLSDDAGRYVCETVYWHALAHRAEAARPLPVAFLHLPPVSDAWPVARLASVVSACLSVLR